MRKPVYNIIVILILFAAQLLAISILPAQTVAFWSFDEPVGLYPSSVVSDLSDNDFPLIMGKGGRIVSGKFGNALTSTEPENIHYPEGEASFGLDILPIPKGRTQEPMNWRNARFSALMTNGENHLRKQVDFPHPTCTGLNLGRSDWTVEFWYKPSLVNQENGVIFELGSGPRAENDRITRLQVNPGQDGFTLINFSPDRVLYIPSSIPPPGSTGQYADDWSHMAFVYSSREKQLYHYMNGKLQKLPAKFKVKSLPKGEEDYFSLARDGRWEQALPGCIDELRISNKAIYTEEFDPPKSLVPNASRNNPKDTHIEHLPLLFARDSKNVIELGSRKHLFIDDAFLERVENCSFQVNPPKMDKCVVSDIQGTFRKHLSIVEDEEGLIRMYYGGPDDCLEVMISHDGINFEIPDLNNGEYLSRKNVVIKEPSAMGNVFIDPEALPGERWKYVSDFNRRGIYLFASPDGFIFTRMRTAILPFRSGSQSNTFYDDQQNKYISYHRSDFTRTKAGGTRRTFVMSEAEVVDRPWPYIPAGPGDYAALEGKMNMRSPVPWYLDNGPLTPGGFSIEFPEVFSETDSDPPETDIYVPKVIKYPWAPDVYLAFPLMYFHYEDSGDLLRTILFDPSRSKGSGTIETQMAVSRDAHNWHRYPRPAYIGIGRHSGSDIKQAYMAHGMVCRGDEIWQYYFGETRYHSSHQNSGFKREVYRLIQRLDGFVSIDAPYSMEGYVYTKPFKFSGNKLEINVDTDATGFVQVGFLDEFGNPVPGFSLDECIYINGDFIATQVEWIQNASDLEGIDIGKEEDYEKYHRLVKTSKDVSPLEGKTVKLVFRMRGSKLYAMNFKYIMNQNDASKINIP